MQQGGERARAAQSARACTCVAVAIPFIIAWLACALCARTNPSDSKPSEAEAASAAHLGHVRHPIQLRPALVQLLLLLSVLDHLFGHHFGRGLPAESSR
jgi:hypothetical protein